MRVVVLVEGPSDAAAVGTLLTRRGIAVTSGGGADDAIAGAGGHVAGVGDAGDGAAVVSMGGITNIGRFLDVYGFGERGCDGPGCDGPGCDGPGCDGPGCDGPGSDGPGRPALGLCDAGEQGVVMRALNDRGVSVPDRAGLAGYGFYVCTADLEDEMIRALGPAAVEDALAALGEAARFRAFQRQPEWRSRPLHDQLHRFAGSGSGRKVRLARRLADLLTPATTPAPLAGLLERVARHLTPSRSQGT